MQDLEELLHLVLSPFDLDQVGVEPLPDQYEYAYVHYYHSNAMLT